MNKSIKLTESQIKAYENGATMFLFPIENKDIIKHNENDTGKLDEDKEHCIKFPNFTINQGDKDIFVQEEFDFGKHYCNATLENFEALKKLGFKPLNNGTQKYLEHNKYMLWTGESSWDFENEKIIDEFQAIYARSKCELLRYTKYEMILENEAFVSKKQSRYSFSKCINVKVIKVQDIKIDEVEKILGILNIGFNGLFGKFRDFHNKQLKELGINRTYEDNDYVFLVELER